MGKPIAAVWTELLKARRSRVPAVTMLAFTVAALVGGLFMFVLQDQRRARAMGLLGAKASLVGGDADWPAYFSMLAQTIAVGGLLIFGLVFVWSFGREFSERTITDLLALPTARTTIVVAKFAVAAAWCMALSVQTYLLGIVIGAALGLPGWSATIAISGLTKIVATSAMTVLLVTPFALAASVGRGYLRAVGFMFWRCSAPRSSRHSATATTSRGACRPCSPALPDPTTPCRGRSATAS
ncbi:ABC transporter permease [Actinopolymorpha sp. B9G3]|uniref:ABC transporter permease n=1 Tax=Actinopolymorpha sp. B9G3 TaxID=3158970 RepID=UPI0032D9A027